MTSQAYQADDGQLAPEHDYHTVGEDNPIEPVVNLAAEPDAAEADTTDTTDTDTTDADTTEADAEQTAHEDLMPDRADAVALGDSEPASSTVPRYPNFTPDADGGAAEPAMANGSAADPAMANGSAAEPAMADSGNGPSLVSVAFTVPESVPEPHPAGTTSTEGPWNEVQAIFVDDPQASIARAADLVDNRVEALIQSVRERQHSILSAGQAEHAGTEELRVALQHYRSFWHSLEDLPAPR